MLRPTRELQRQMRRVRWYATLLRLAYDDAARADLAHGPEPSLGLQAAVREITGLGRTLPPPAVSGGSGELWRRGWTLGEVCVAVIDDVATDKRLHPRRDIQHVLLACSTYVSTTLWQRPDRVECDQAAIEELHRRGMSAVEAKSTVPPVVAIAIGPALARWLGKTVSTS